MKDTELIKNLHNLYNIKPDTNWAVSARAKAFAYAKESAMSRQERVKQGFSWALFGMPMRVASGSALAIVVVFSGVLAVAQNSLPGDTLYSVKVVSERVESAVSSDENQVKKDANFALRRVDELSRITQESGISRQDGSIVAKRVEAYKQSLAEVAKPGVVNQKDQTNATEIKVIKESAETLAVALRATEGKTDLVEALKVTITQRMSSCRDSKIIQKLQGLFATGDLADLIEANELSVRCTE